MCHRLTHKFIFAWTAFVLLRQRYSPAEVNNYDLSVAGGAVTKCRATQTLRANRMNYYAHTAEDENGKPLPEDSGQWQPLRTHLANVAKLAGRFAAPLNLTAEATLAGLLHDLGKYAERFQARLRNPAVHGINHWAAGAAHAATLKASAVCLTLHPRSAR
jgi:hypothetical protein